MEGRDESKMEGMDGEQTEEEEQWARLSKKWAQKHRKIGQKWNDRLEENTGLIRGGEEMGMIRMI